MRAESDRDAEKIIRELRARGYRLDESLEHTKAGQLATARLTAERFSVIVDLLFASSGIESEVVSAAEEIEITPGLKLPVATTEHLVALKMLARDDQQRPQDLGDLLALVRHQPTLDLDRIRKSLDAITERGFNRGRDLRSEFRKVFPAG